MPWVIAMTEPQDPLTGKPVEFVGVNRNCGLSISATDEAIVIEAIEYGSMPYEVQHAVVAIGAEEARRLARWLEVFAASRTQTAADPGAGEGPGSAAHQPPGDRP